jgi:hypothetical protein
MKKRVFIKDESALAGVIELLLLIALFAIILGMIQLIYIPEIMEQKESDHMDEVSNQFSRLKAMIDIQAKEKTDIPISTQITFGSKKLPYFVTVPAHGELTIIDKDDTTYEIKINDAITYDLTSIKYKAHNQYFVSQTYVLEAGGVIIKQPDGKPVMWVNPALNATPFRDGYGDVTIIKMYFDIPIIICNSDNNNIGGSGNYYVRTNYSNELSDTDWNYLSDISNINISTEYPNAWFEFFNYSFEKDVKNNITFYKGLDYVKIQKNSIEIDLYYRKTCIYAQID